MLIGLKGIITLALLEKIVLKAHKYINGDVFVALFVTVFFPFLCLSTLSPVRAIDFGKTKFPSQNDLFWDLLDSILYVLVAGSRSPVTQPCRRVKT